jgi:glycosyltransferase involved in cell wall biosynthesis
MEQTKVSIIVPVFNAEKFLDDCIKSVLAQTFTDYELILVDDGSTDSSLAICQSYANQNSQIKVVHQENGGLSVARNSGIEVASGDYLTFLDSDDMLDPYFLERMMAVVDRYNADWVQCGALFGSDRVLNGKRNCKEFIYQGRKALLHDNIKVRVWGAIYYKRAFENTKFPLVRIYEDEAIYYKLVYNSKIAVRIDDELYYYYFNPDSLSKKEYDLVDDSFIKVFEEREEYFKQLKDRKMIVKTRERFCRSLMVLYVRCKKNKNNKNDTKKYLKQIRRLTRKILFSCVPSLKSKIQCLSFSLAPRLATKFSIKHKLNSRFL